MLVAEVAASDVRWRRRRRTYHLGRGKNQSHLSWLIIGEAVLEHQLEIVNTFLSPRIIIALKSLLY